MIEYDLNEFEDFPFDKVAFDFVCRMRYTSKDKQCFQLQEKYLQDFLKDTFSLELIIAEELVYNDLIPIKDKYEFCQEIIIPTFKKNSNKSDYTKEVFEYLFSIRYLDRNADPEDLRAAMEYSGEIFKIIEQSTYLNSLEEIDELIKTEWYNSLWDVCEEPICDMAVLLFNNKTAWLEIAYKYFEN